MSLQIERVLITGGTGFIGGALADRLLAKGLAVDVLTRDRRRVERRFEGRARGIESLDELEPDRPARVVVNLAGKNLGDERWDEHVKEEIVRSRVETTRQVIEYIERAKPRPDLLISGSAVGYYGARRDETLDESAAPGDEYQARLCVRWEDAASVAAEYGVRTCISRTGVVIGAGGGALEGLVPLFRKGLGAVIGDGRQWISWIALEDLLRLFEDFIADESLSGVFNNTAPNPVTNREFSKGLGKVLGRPTLLRIPGPAYRLMFGGIARLHLTGQRVVPSRHRERGFEYRYPTLESALAAALRSRS